MCPLSLAWAAPLAMFPIGRMRLLDMTIDRQTATKYFPKKDCKRESIGGSMANIVQLRPTRSTRPRTENGKVHPPARVPNRDRRSREHLTSDEVDKLMAAAGGLGRHGHRDATLILLA